MSLFIIKSNAILNRYKNRNLKGTKTNNKSNDWIHHRKVTIIIQNSSDNDNVISYMLFPNSAYKLFN